jgi:small GTP-binding protein
MTIWDTAGQEKFKTITQTYYKGAMGIVLTFAVNERKSFEAIDKWMKQIHENASEDVKIVLVGNKCDLTDREVQYKEGEALAQRYRIRYIETSALENLNVHELFLGIATDIKIHLESAPKPQGSTSSSISGKKLGDDKRGKEKKKKGCC